MITQRSTYQAENWTSNTKKPHQVIPQSYFRYEPISPSYDPNEFVKNYNKKTHQKFRQLRPAKKRPYQWIFEFFLRDWQELDEILPTIATKNQKFEENLRKKLISKIAKFQTSTQFQTWNLHVNMMHCIARHNFKLRNDSFSYENWGPGIFLSLSLFKMYQKNVLVHALLRDPLRKPCLRFCLNLRVLNLQNLLKISLK